MESLFIPYFSKIRSRYLFFPAGAQKRYVNRTHIKAWCRGLKGLYYLRTEAKQRAETVAEGVERHVLAEDKRTIVYGKDDCPYCMAVKEELNLRGIPYDYVNLVELGKTAAEVTGRKVNTVPQVYYEGVYVGGYNKLMEHLNQSLTIQSGDECRACEG